MNSGRERARRAILLGALIGTGACLVLTAAMLGQLARRNALGGGGYSGRLYPSEGPAWLHLLVNHVTVGWMSRASDTVGPLLLLALAAWFSARRRTGRPLACTLVALVLLVPVVFAGKGFLGRVLGAGALIWSPSRLSGPATVVVVLAGLAVWLLRTQLGAVVDATAFRWLSALAAAVVLMVGVAQLYLQHRVPAVLFSWLVGLVVLAAVLLIFGGVSARRPRSR